MKLSEQFPNAERTPALPNCFVYLLTLGGKQSKAFVNSELLYNLLRTLEMNVIWDDRDMAPGIKFTLADKTSYIVRIVVSARSLLKGGVEFSLSGAHQLEILSIEAACSRLLELTKETKYP